MLHLRSTVFLLTSLLLAGCMSYSDMNATIAEATGTYRAPVMGGAPRPSGCRTEACLAFDQAEELGYAAVRSGRVTYTKLVDTLWEMRRRVFPNSADGQPIHEYRAFLRALAEQVDRGAISAAQWEYLVEAKLSETLSRERSGVTRCNTTNVGTWQSPNYRTICR